MKWLPFKFTRLLILQLVLGGLILLVYVRQPRPSFEEAVRFIAVLQNYSKDQVQSGRLPDLTRIHDLISAGYVTPKDVRHFEGAEITFASGPSDGDPRKIMISMKLRDGRWIILLGNGNIQQLSSAPF